MISIKIPKIFFLTSYFKNKTQYNHWLTVVKGIVHAKNKINQLAPFSKLTLPLLNFKYKQWIHKTYTKVILLFFSGNNTEYVLKMRCYLIVYVGHFWPPNFSLIYVWSLLYTMNSLIFTPIFSLYLPLWRKRSWVGLCILSPVRGQGERS